MSREVRPIGKAFPALCAGVRLFVCVSGLVSDECRFRHKSSAAFRAGERHFHAMDLHVFSEMRGPGKGSATLAARKRLLTSVHPFVAGEIVLGHEAFSAFRAAVRLLASVDGLVGNKTTPFSKTLPALWAGKFCIRVGLLMLPELGCFSEALSTLRAGKWLYPSVVTLVTDELPLIIKFSPTFHAGKQLCGRLTFTLLIEI